MKNACLVALAAVIALITAPLRGDDLGAWQAPSQVTVEQVDAYASKVWRVAGAEADKPPHMAIIHAPGEWGDQLFEVDCKVGKDGWAGMRFRNRYDLFINDRGFLVLRRDYKVIASSPTRLGGDAYHRLRIIAVGGQLIAEADGVRRITHFDDTQLQGRSGVLIHGATGEVAAVKLTDRIPAADLAQLSFVKPDDALVFLPGAPVAVNLRFNTLADSSSRGQLRAAIAPALRDNPRTIQLDGFADLPEHTRVIHEDGQPILRFGGDSVLGISQVGYRNMQHDEPWRAFHLKVDVRRTTSGSAGVVFGCDGNVTYEVQFTPDKRLVLRRIDPGWKPVVLGVSQPLFEPDRFHTLEIFRDGANYALLVDGKAQLVGEDDASVSGAVGLLVIRTRADFRNLSISNVLPAHDAVPFNASPPRAPLTYTPDFAGALAASRPKPWATADAAIDLSGSADAVLAFPALPAGLYDLFIDVDFDDGSTFSRMTPLLVADVPQAAPRDADQYELLAYGKYSYDDPVADNTYLHAVCLRLKECGLTGIIHPFQSRKQLDIMQQHGMSAVLRDSMVKWADHPAVITMLVGDEPKAENAESYKQRYADLRQTAPNVTMMTCMVGETTGTDSGHNPSAVWDILEPEHRYLRHYPMRKAAYALLNPSPGHTPMLAALTAARDYDDKDWWFAVQSFGGVVRPQSPAPYWRDPTGAELRAMMNLAAAMGAKGLYFYTFQSEANFNCLVDRRTLRDTDGKAAALRDTAGRLQHMHRTLRGAKPATFDIACDAPTVHLSGYESGRQRWVRLVNLDARLGVVATVTVGDQAVTIPLGPGEAALQAFAAP